MRHHSNGDGENFPIVGPHQELTDNYTSFVSSQLSAEMYQFENDNETSPSTDVHIAEWSMM